MLDEDSQDSEEPKSSIAKFPEVKHPGRLLYNDDGNEQCRVCLMAGSIAIFGDEDISGDLMLFAGIEVNTDDCLPQHICTQCREFLQSAITLRRMAHYSDNILRKTAKNTLQYSEDEEWIQEGSDREVYLELDQETVKSEVIDNTDSCHDSSSIQSNDDLTQTELDSMANDLRTTKEWRCEICDIGFRTIEMIDDHSQCHDAVNIVRCEICQHIVSKGMYNNHLLIHKQLFKQRVEKKYRKVECHVCGSRVSKTYIKTHMTMHGPDVLKAKRYKKCTICDKLISANYYNGHIKRHQPAEAEAVVRKKCHICSLMIQEHKYKNHLLSHAARIKKYVCEDCGKEFHYPSVFKTHLLTHKDEFKLKCEFCPYQAKHLGLLKMHVRTHTKDYPYKCTVCEKSFISKSNLSAHERVHSEPQCICTDCGKSFRHERALSLHYENVHNGVKNFQCDMCSKAFVRNSMLKAHKKTAHHVKYEGRIGRKPSYLLVAEKEKDNH